MILYSVCVAPRRWHVFRFSLLHQDLLTIWDQKHCNYLHWTFVLDVLQFNILLVFVHYRFLVFFILKKNISMLSLQLQPIFMVFLLNIFLCTFPIEDTVSFTNQITIFVSIFVLLFSNYCYIFYLFNKYISQKVLKTKYSIFIDRLFQNTNKPCQIRRKFCQKLTKVYFRRNMV